MKDPRPTFTEQSATRRDVLRGLAGLGLLALTRCASAKTGAEVLANDSQSTALIDSAIGIDMHSHAAGANVRAKPTYDLAERMRTGRMTAVCLCHPGDAPVIRRDPDNRIRTVRQPEPGELWRFTEQRLRWFDGLVSAQGFRRD